MSPSALSAIESVDDSGMGRYPKWRKWPSPAKTDLVLDSNVMLEVLSVGDLETESVKAAAKGDVLASADYRNRQLRSRCSTLLAWHCAQNRLNTESLLEFVDILSNKLAPQDRPRSYTYTRLLVRSIKPRIFNGWVIKRIPGVPPNLRGHAADTAYLRAAANSKTPLITNEGVSAGGYQATARNLRGRCSRAGVPVYSPKEYLDAIGFDIPGESVRFLEALDRAVLEIRDARIFTSEPDLDTLEKIPMMHRFILFDEVDPDYDVDQWPTIPWYHGKDGEVSKVSEQ